MRTLLRVAQVLGEMNGYGVENVVMNYYRHIDRSRIQFDFIVHSDSALIPSEEIAALGGRVYVVPPYQHIYSYLQILIKLFRENHYQIVHAHLSTLSVFPLFAAKCAGVPIRIAHSHSTAGNGEILKNMVKYMLRPFSKVFATHYAACSRYAGEWLFGKKAMEEGKVTIFNNAIDLDKFKYDEDVRNEVRRELGIEGKFVIGHVGRFCYQKNQEFLIDIFEEVYKQDPNAVLLLIGDGKDRPMIEEKVRKLSGGGVILLGNRNDCERLYQAMDVFVFPSRYEGIGIAAIEAQVRGLRVIASTNVPREASISDGIDFLSLDAGAQAWAETALGLVRTVELRGECLKAYDISKQVKRLEKFYEEIRNAGKETGLSL